MSSGEVDEMEKKSRAQQAAERLYNQIVVEGRRKPEKSCPMSWSWPGRWG